MPRLLGIDYGRVRIGLAVCDDLGISTTALGFVRRESDALAAVIVAAIAKREGAAALVIGLPLHAHGAEGGNVRWVRAFCVELANTSTKSKSTSLRAMSMKRQARSRFLSSPRLLLVQADMTALFVWVA